MPVPDRDAELISAPEDIYHPTDDASLGQQALSDSVPQGAATTVSKSSAEQEPLPEFDPKYRLDFEGLLYLGHLTDDFVWMGHKFRIRTITTNEYLEVGLLHQRYKDSIGDVRAYTTAIVAACLESVDGKDIPIAIDRTVQETGLAYRFSWVADHWYPWIIDTIYERFQVLEGRVEAVLSAMGKASG